MWITRRERLTRGKEGREKRRRGKMEGGREQAVGLSLTTTETLWQ